MGRRRVQRSPAAAIATRRAETRGFRPGGARSRDRLIARKSATRAGACQPRRGGRPEIVAAYRKLTAQVTGILEQPSRACSVERRRGFILPPEETMAYGALRRKLGDAMDWVK